MVVTEPPFTVPHCPPAQPAPLAQAVPHLPQLLGSVSRLLSQPSLALPLQSLKGWLQLAMPQALLVQTPVALAGAQWTPQPPQLSRLVLVSGSQPSAALWLQSSQGAGREAGGQGEAAQAAAACA